MSPMSTRSARSSLTCSRFVYYSPVLSICSRILTLPPARLHRPRRRPQRPRQRARRCHLAPPPGHLRHHRRAAQGHLRPRRRCPRSRWRSPRRRCRPPRRHPPDRPPAQRERPGPGPRALSPVSFSLSSAPSVPALLLTPCSVGLMTLPDAFMVFMTTARSSELLNPQCNALTVSYITRFLSPRFRFEFSRHDAFVASA